MPAPNKLVLASQSPRRAELLTQIGIAFSQLPVDIDESQHKGEKPEDYVCRMATEKAQAGWQQSKQDCPVLGSDTICVLNGQVLQKPTDFADFQQTARSMSGQTHQVLTAIAICYDKHMEQALVSTDVTFKPLSDKEIEWYWQTGEPQDKAGGYGIQGLGGRFVKRINGSYSAVVGLPLYETSVMLELFANPAEGVAP